MKEQDIYKKCDFCEPENMATHNQICNLIYTPDWWWKYTTLLNQGILAL